MSSDSGTWHSSRQFFLCGIALCGHAAWFSAMPPKFLVFSMAIHHVTGLRSIVHGRRSHEFIIIYKMHGTPPSSFQRFGVYLVLDLFLFSWACQWDFLII